MKWHLYDDFRLALNGRMGEHDRSGPARLAAGIFLAGKVVFLTLAFALPSLLHPLWVVASVYVLTASVLGLVLAVVFQLAHCVEQADFPVEHRRVGSTTPGPFIRSRPASTLRVTASPRAGCSAG